MKKICRATDGDLLFYCPGCKEYHGVNSSWTFNGNFELPSLSPSILVTGTQPLTDDEYQRIMAGEKIQTKPMRCHSYVREGKILYLSDCTHELAGKTVDLQVED